MTVQAPTRQRSGGRSEQVRLAVGRAVHDLLAEGRFPFTTTEVAERAGVNRPTVYRWWPSHDHLLREALAHHAHNVEAPDTGSWAADLRTFAHRIADFAADPVDVTLTRIMVSGLYPGFAAAMVDHFEPIRSGWREMVRRAVLSGQASDAHDPGTVVDLLVSPLFLAPLTTGQRADQRTVDRLVDLVLDATRVRG